MLKFTKSLAAVTSILLGSAAFAQDSATPAQPLSTGEDLKAAAPEVTTEVFGDWTLNCQVFDDGENCQLYQLLKQDGNPVVEVNLFNVSDGGQVFAGGSVVAPLETLLTAQLTIAVDDSLAKRYPFAFCTATGCISRIGLTEEDVNTYKKGNVATVTIVPAAAADRPVQLEMSLSGFTKAFDALKAK